MFPVCLSSTSFSVDWGALEKLVTEWIHKHGREASSCLPLLQEMQNHFGYLPSEGMELITRKTDVSARQLYGVATFYAQFRLTPPGKYLVKVCHGTACHVRGAPQVSLGIRHHLQIPPGQETSPDGQYTLEEVACLGCCSLAPVISIDNQVHGDLSGTKAAEVLKKHQAKIPEDSP
jgi:NADH:ubiquinone oxidoreductase subunit E